MKNRLFYFAACVALVLSSVSCSSDIGEALNSGAHLIGLIRTRVGEVKLEDCMQVEDFPEWLDRQEIEVINE